MESAQFKILGGLPVTIEYSIDEPSGLLHSWKITEINERPCKKLPTWLYNRINAKVGEATRISNDIFNRHYSRRV
jgi:hypothetical protein